MNRSPNKALILIMALLIIFCIPLLQHVPIVHASEPSLTDIFNSLGFTNVTSITVETFPAGTYNITLYAKFGGDNPSKVDVNELSYYQVNTSSFNVLFTPSEPTIYGYVTPPLTKTFSADYQFGLSLLSYLGSRYYTETHLNPGWIPQAEIYLNLNDPSMLLIGFDENSNGCNAGVTGDGDFNDMVFSLQLQYYLNVISTYSTPKGQGWYGNGTNAFASLADGVVDQGNGTRRVFTQWNNDASGTNFAQSNPIYMNQNKTAVAVWNTQYYLTVKTDPTGLTTIPGEGWYDQGTSPTINAPTVTGYNFVNWDVDGTSQGKGTNPITLTLNGPHTATAHYSQAPPPLIVTINPPSASIILGQSVKFNSTVSGGSPPYTYQWYENNKPVTGATSNSWKFTPNADGTYYVYLQVTDSNNSTAQSPAAKVEVTQVVGGYSIAIPRPTTIEPLTLNVGAVVAFAIFFISIRRKTRKRN